MHDDNVGSPPPGWYPHPHLADTRRYWDGQEWTDHTAAMTVAPPLTPHKESLDSASVWKIVAVGLTAAAIIGVVMAVQSASLLSGTSSQWTGFAIAASAAVGAVVLHDKLPNWVFYLCVAAAIASFASVRYLEQQLDHQRQQIDRKVDRIFGD